MLRSSKVWGRVFRVAPRIIELLVICIVASHSAADTTVWTNPNGGAWNDPANWSNGIPDLGQSAVIPQLDADGCTITLEGQGTCDALTIVGLDAGRGSEKGVVRLTSGALSVIGTIAIGAPGFPGSLALDHVTVSAVSMSIGVGASGLEANGTLTLDDGAVLAVSSTDAGLYGTSQVTVSPTASLLGYTWRCHEGSTVSLVVAPSSETLVTMYDWISDGTLHVECTETMGLPTPEKELLFCIGACSGSFDVVELPVVGGFEIPLTLSEKSIKLSWFNPVISATIMLPSGHDAPMVGFPEDLWVEVILYTGPRWDCSDGWSCPFYFTVESGDAWFGTGHDKDVLTIASPGEVTVSATAQSYSQPITVAETFTPEIAPTWMYRRLASLPNGDAPSSSADYSELGPRWTPDTRWAVFSHWSSEFGADPHPSSPDVFVRDTLTADVTCVSAGASGPKNVKPDISGDGRHVVFVSGSTYQGQIWLHDRLTNTTTPISISPAGELADAPCDWPRISRDGSTVVFCSMAQNLGTLAIAGTWQVITRDLATGAMNLVSAAPDSLPGNGHSRHPSISADGRFVSFDTEAGNLIESTNGFSHVLLTDRWKGTIEAIDRTPDGALGGGDASHPSITPSGQRVVFTSKAPDLDPADVDNKNDGFVYDRTTGLVTWVTPNLDSTPPISNLIASAISDDGEFVAYGGGFFEDGEWRSRAARIRLASMQTEPVSLDPWGANAELILTLQQFSGDGNQLLYLTTEREIIPFISEYSAQPVARIFEFAGAADLNHDGYVNAADLSLLLGAWGSTESTADLDQDGAVSSNDLALLFASWSS